MSKRYWKQKLSWLKKIESRHESEKYQRHLGLSQRDAGDRKLGSLSEMGAMIYPISS